MPKKRPTWSARFSEPVDERVKRFTASVGFDRRLAKYDIQASRAHARMLAAQRILSRRDLAAITRGLTRISKEIDGGRFRWSLDAEDVHLNIERRLTALVGDAGKRLHTARSRNDQVATDVRLWLRDQIDGLRALVSQLELALLDQAQRQRQAQEASADNAEMFARLVHHHEPPAASKGRGTSSMSCSRTCRPRML